MIYGSCMFIYAILPQSVHSRYGWLVAYMLAVFAVLVTVYYTQTWNFKFFETVRKKHTPFFLGGFFCGFGT